MKKSILITIFLIVLFLFGCTAVMMKHPCSSDTAYAEGIKDAKANKQMINNYAEFCPGNQVALNSAYHHGYIAAIFSEKHAVAANNPAAATASAQQCVEGPDGKACGYHCMKSIKMVKCATQPSDNCAGDNSGNIKCGMNCRVEAGHIKCDKER